MMGNDTVGPQHMGLTDWRLIADVMSPDQANAILHVVAERRKQFEKWGKQHHSPEWWLAILMEEVGELAECILHGEFGGPEAKNRGKELVQVAAVALAMLEDGI